APIDLPPLHLKARRSDAVPVCIRIDADRVALGLAAPEDVHTLWRRAERIVQLHAAFSAGLSWLSLTGLTFGNGGNRSISSLMARVAATYCRLISCSFSQGMLAYRDGQVLRRSSQNTRFHS